MGRFAAAVFFCVAYHHCWAAEPYQEYNKRIESAQTLTALKSDLMGDSVSLYNGVTEFSVSDIEVSGSGLPLRLMRRFSVDLQPMGPGEPLATPKLGGMGNWDVDVPYISGTFDAGKGWRGLNSTGGLTDQEILSARQRIAATSDSNDRAVLMLELVHKLSALEPSQVNSVDDGAVDAVAAMLTMDGEVGRYYGAKALSAISCRAGRSLPVLREALELSAPVRSDFEPLVLAPSVSPRAEIETAIAKIEEASQCP